MTQRGERGVRRYRTHVPSRRSRSLRSIACRGRRRFGCVLADAGSLSAPFRQASRLAICWRSSPVTSRCTRSTCVSSGPLAPPASAVYPGITAAKTVAKPSGNGELANRTAQARLPLSASVSPMSPRGSGKSATSAGDEPARRRHRASREENYLANLPRDDPTFAHHQPMIGAISTEETPRHFEGDLQSSSPALRRAPSPPPKNKKKTASTSPPSSLTPTHHHAKPKKSVSLYIRYK